MNPHLPPFASRRDFLKTSTAAALGVALTSGPPSGFAALSAGPAAGEKAAKTLYDSLSDAQKKEICFDWDYRVDIKYGRKPLTIPDPNGILLRAHISNAWHITPPLLGSAFYTDDQRAMIMEILKAILSPGWPEKLVQQAQDDTGQAWGQDQALAFFGTPGQGRFQCVITGFHLTLRAGGGDPDSRTAFGGAISHGHQPTGFYEKPGHPGNIFWRQAQIADGVYQVLDGKQREKALFTGPVPYPVPPGSPDHPLDLKLIDRGLVRDGVPRDDTREAEIRFRELGQIPGLPVGDMSRDQKEAMRKVLDGLLDPYCEEYRRQVTQCLDKQGGLESCRLIFYQQKRMSDDAWDNWRLEGPSFVWYFRGTPHVHIWIHVAEDAHAPVSAYFG